MEEREEEREKVRRRTNESGKIHIRKFYPVLQGQRRE